MSHEVLVYVCAGVALVGLVAYAVLAGADFGGGVWDLLASGPRRRLQRETIAGAMGPVWEANHVWLIFVIVVLFTCFPKGYAALSVALFVPFHVALLGIMLRGAAFVFRGYETKSGDRAAVWGHVFGVASVVSPVILGAGFGAVTEGAIRVSEGGEVRVAGGAWMTPYAVACGVLALSTCAYLAAVYLVAETEGELREDFRRRAVWAGTATAGLAIGTLVLAHREARWFFERLTAPAVWPVLLGGIALFAGSAFTVFRRKYRAARVCAAGEIALLLLGWGVAYQPYLVYPDVTLVGGAAPRETLGFMVGVVVLGAVVLVPSLWLLFRVFKSEKKEGGAGY